MRRTIWGPVIGDDAAGHELALAWTAHRPGSGGPPAHRARARTGPRRSGGDDRRRRHAGAERDARGQRRPHRLGAVRAPAAPAGLRSIAALGLAYSRTPAGRAGSEARESPRLLDPPDGRAWSANARVVGGEALALIGDGGYAPAARARQIRDRLGGLEQATPADLLGDPARRPRGLSRVAGSRCCSPPSSAAASARLRTGRAVGRARGRRRMPGTGCCASSSARSCGARLRC